MPSGASSYSSLVDQTFWLILGSSVILLLGITATMILFMVRYRRARHPEAAQIEGSVRLETLWTVLPTILVLVMFWYGWAGFKVMRDVPEDAMKVTVYAQKWSWIFEYESGMQSAELVVPTGEPVALDLVSNDVIHSFFVPAFRLKEDCMPGRVNTAWFESTRDGEYDLFCAEYCGDRHSAMLSKVRSLPRPVYDQWVADGGGGMVGTKLLTLKGCMACHSLDGSRLIGPSFKDVFGREEWVLTDGERRRIVVDEDYIRRSLREPNADVVEGYDPVMPPMTGIVNDEELETIIQILKSLDVPAGEGE